MMKDDELWLKKIKERLDDYSEPLPDTGWERLCWWLYRLLACGCCKVR